MKVLVTGGCGFIGSHIVDLLVESGYDSAVIDNLSTGSAAFLHPEAKWHHVDLLSQTDVDAVFAHEKPDYVIHQAAQTSVPASIADPSADALINIFGTLTVLHCCVKYNVKKIIFASSCAVYGDAGDTSITESSPVRPTSFYAASKQMGELYIRLFHRYYGLTYTILRYANVYGPRQSAKNEGGVVAALIRKQLAKEPPVIFGDGNQTRDFVFVKDVAWANVLSLTKGDNNTFNIGTNQGTTINELAALIASFFPSPIRCLYHPERPGDIRHSRLNAEQANRQLGWLPKYDLETGLAETVRFYRSNNFTK
ncbi:NAD-dependent epimerase/dehydratase family protein [Geobacillus sp. BK01]|uniref:NAD-dependent epimerase/dehydratase family protein n=1 Tax=Geobacillus sp. BK01 TaxID=3457328 RepID=UPI003FA5B1BC